MTTRETDCYSWHGPIDRHTGLRYGPLQGQDPMAPGSLSPEANLAGGLLLFVLCGVEASPGAGCLLGDQRI
jgi:hypothetical protein